LKEGLTDRIKSINIQEAEVPSWPVKSAEPALEEESSLVSVVFDPGNIDRLVDHGPAAEEKKKAAQFQKFWGEKAELRRFKDGSILESLVWSPGSGYGVFQQIVTYLLKRHFGSDAGNDLQFNGEEFEKFLPGTSSSTKNFDALKQSFNVFEKQIRDLEGLPLQLRQLSAASSQLRYSSIESPSGSSRQPQKQPADVLIQFEGSGRWPDDIVAIQRTKIAFLLKIGALLQEVDDTITSRVGLENEERPLENCSFLDVIYESGAAFRLRIHNDREQTLLERQVKDKSTDQHSREAAVSALSIYKRSFVQIPLLTQSIATHCTRFPLLSPTIRLVKMWFDRHMLSPHVSEELIELLVARVFLQPYPWRAPSSVMTGFLRTLLFISRWDWRSVPLIVDFTGTMTSNDVDAVNTRLEAWRKIDPSMSRTVLFAASNHDTTGTAFTDAGPSKMVAARMTALARSACKLVKDKGHDLDYRSLFAGSTADYDFVIHISPKFTGDSRQKQSDQSKFKNLVIQSEVNKELVGYNPVQTYLEELKKLYTSSFVLFHGSLIGSVIAGLWNPQIVGARPFKVNLAYATKLAEVGQSEKNEDAIELDRAAILAEIARLGGDMVSRIETNR
jgi:U3 small nucleolar RNA-associated protein 22